MRVLFLDDQPEILDIYRQIHNPQLVEPSNKEVDLFAPTEGGTQDTGFQRVRNIEFKGSFFLSAGEAIERFRRFANAVTRFKVAVLDMQLPDSSGLEVARRLLELDPNINILFVTAYSDYSIHDIARILDMEESRFMFLKKPFELQEIIQCLFFIREKLDREMRQQEALKNLIDFNKNFQVESLEMFDVIFQLDTLEMARNVANKRVRHILEKNARLLERTEMILANGIKNETDSFTIAELLGQFDAQKNISVEYDPEAFEGKPLKGNLHQLVFALQALVKNGQEYSNGAVTISARLTDKNLIEFMVRDKGPGIDPKYHNEIFEPGFKLEPKSPKAGFGLSLVKKIVCAHHKSDLFISSEPGKGTAIKFSLPPIG